MGYWRTVDIISRSLTQTKEALYLGNESGERPRTVTIPTGTLAILAAHRKQQAELRCQFGPDYRAELDLIFANPDGSPLKPDSVSAAVSLLFLLGEAACASLHSLRHTHCSQLLANGVDLATASERLDTCSRPGHRGSIPHALRGRDDEAARRWEEFQERPGSAPRRPSTVA